MNFQGEVVAACSDRALSSLLPRPWTVQFDAAVLISATLEVVFDARAVNGALALNALEVLRGFWSDPVMAKRWDVYFISTSPLPAAAATPHAL